MQRRLTQGCNFPLEPGGSSSIHVNAPTNQRKLRIRLFDSYYYVSTVLLCKCYYFRIDFALIFEFFSSKRLIPHRCDSLSRILMLYFFSILLLLVKNEKNFAIFCKKRSTQSNMTVTKQQKISTEFYIDFCLN